MDRGKSKDRCQILDGLMPDHFYQDLLTKSFVHIFSIVHTSTLLANGGTKMSNQNYDFTELLKEYQKRKRELSSIQLGSQIFNSQLLLILIAEITIALQLDELPDRILTRMNHWIQEIKENPPSSNNEDLILVLEEELQNFHGFVEILRQQ